VEPTQKVHISDLYIDIVREGFRELVAGARLTGGRFTLSKLLGQGGMGAVWLARDEVYEREVALKLLPAEMANDDSGLQDLEREVAKTATLEHANILKIEGLVRTEGEPPFILMEYVEGTEALQGTDLDQVRRQTPNRLMPWSGVRHYMLQLCDALEYAHNQKIAHRDLKPSNLLINRQAQLKLADFGIAASIAGTASAMTVSVLDAGTPSYMSPQQIEGRQPQAADDIYSLGATFYDLLTSKPPFYQGDLVHQVLNMEATSIGKRLKELQLQNEVPDYVSSMVMACLQKDPGMRPPTAGAVKKWIESEGKADFAAVRSVKWEEAPMPTQVGVAPAVPSQAASEVKRDWLPAAQRKKILAYGAVAAVLSILIGTATWWTGKMKEVNGVSAAMQQQLEEGLVAYYPFNGNAKDESGNGLHGKVVGAVYSEGGLLFDGKSHVGIPQSEKLVFGTNDFSYCAWIKSPKTLGYSATIVGEDQNHTPMRVLVVIESSRAGFVVRGGNDKMAGLGVAAIQPKPGGGGGAPQLDPATGLPIGGVGGGSPNNMVTDDKWHHLVGTKKGSTYSLAVDGKIIAKQVNSEINSSDTGVPVRIGGRHNKPNPFSGLIDEVRIYNRALSEEEVAALYNLERPATKAAEANTGAWVSDPNDPNNVKIEAAIRKELKKPTGELTNADLEKVTELNLFFNQLTEVPKGLVKLNQLTVLNLNHNKLTDVSALANLTQLEYLRLHDNQLTEIPKELENLTQLKVLYLGWNKLTEVPKGLVKLNQLTELNLNHNKLTEVPKGLEKLTQLKVLRLDFNKLTSVKGLENLTQLKSLHLGGNPALTKAQIDELQKALPKCQIHSNATK
jgi:hypothetical protein